MLRPAEEHEVLDYHSGGLYIPPNHPQFNDYGEPIRPAGSGTTHAMQEMVAARARAHMQEPHHTMPAPTFGGSFGGGGGGHTLSRVQSIIGQYPGARITSTYRSPSTNAAVGGAARSLHMDRGNPATDIGGPMATLDAIHARLRSMGGWRELIWRAPGHYDHVHVAEEGGIYEQSFDSGGYLRPGYTLAYNGTGMPERVLTYAEGGLIGDTFYGEPGGFRKRERRFSDEDGAQFDYMKNRRERKAFAHPRLDWGTPHRRGDGIRPSYEYRAEWKEALQASRDASREMRGLVGAAARGGTPQASVTPVPMNTSTDNSVNFTIGSGAVRVDVRAEVGAEPSGMRRNIARAVEEALGAFQADLKAEIRARRR